MPTPKSQRGFTMALALAMAVVMGLMLMKAGPLVSKEVQRENEKDLIFRGEAIATALRLYATKRGGYPTSLDDVLKVKPRILRQKYRDPMTPGGEWEYVTQVQPGASGNKDGLPIIGVRSRGNQNSIHIYQNKTQVRDWLFSAEQNVLGVTDDPGRTRLPKGTGTPEFPGLPKAGDTPTFPSLPTGTPTPQ